MKYILFLTFLIAFGEAAFAQGLDRRKDVKSQTLLKQSKTTLDFNETMIDGKMKAPNGFFIQGRKNQSLSQMVKLRSSFRNRIDSSVHSVRAIVK